MQTRFLMAFEHSLPCLPDAEGRDQITSAGRVGQAPYQDVLTNIVQVTAPDAVIAAMKASGDYPWYEDVIEEVLPDA